MPDWMSKLEQAKRLLDSGALNQEEYDREKSRILGGESAAGYEMEEHEQVASSRKRFVLGATALVGVLLAAFWFWNFFQAASPTDNSAFSIPAVADAALETTEEATEAASAAPTDLTSSLYFSNLGECTAGGTLEKVFAKLDSARDGQSQSQTVKLDEFADALKVNVAQSTNSDGVLKQSADIKFDGEVSWNGLRLSRIKTGLIAPPESDSNYSRLLTFREDPETVRSALSRIGMRVPLDPAYAELSGGQDSCGGAMSIQTIPGGAALSCSWGC